MSADKATDPVDRPSTVGDEELFCSACGYNLTGNTDRRCSECGAAFDRSELLRLRDGGFGPVPIWDERHETGWPRALARFAVAAWFTPIRLARRFPPVVDECSGRRLGWTCWATATAISLAISAWSLRLFAAVLIGSLLTSVVYFVFLSVMASYAANARRVRSQSGRPPQVPSGYGHMHVFWPYLSLILIYSSISLYSVDYFAQSPSIALAILAAPAAYLFVQVTRVVSDRHLSPQFTLLARLATPGIIVVAMLTGLMIGMGAALCLMPLVGLLGLLIP